MAMRACSRAHRSSNEAPRRAGIGPSSAPSRGWSRRGARRSGVVSALSRRRLAFRFEFVPFSIVHTVYRSGFPVRFSRPAPSARPAPRASGLGLRSSCGGLVHAPWSRLVLNLMFVHTAVFLVTSHHQSSRYTHEDMRQAHSRQPPQGERRSTHTARRTYRTHTTST